MQYTQVVFDNDDISLFMNAEQSIPQVVKASEFSVISAFASLSHPDIGITRGYRAKSILDAFAWINHYPRKPLVWHYWIVDVYIFVRTQEIYVSGWMRITNEH